MGHAESSGLGLGKPPQTAGTGHVGRCLLTLSALHPLSALASVVVTLCSPSHWQALASDAGAPGALATGSEPLVVGLSTSLESTRQGHGDSELTFPRRSPQASSGCVCHHFRQAGWVLAFPLAV